MRNYPNYSLLFDLWEHFDSVADPADALAVAKKIQKEVQPEEIAEAVRDAQDAIRVAHALGDYTFPSEYRTIVVKNELYALFFVDEDGILIDAEFNLDREDIVPAYIELANDVEEHGAGGYAENDNGRLYRTAI